jgi:hypothetical protein
MSIGSQIVKITAGSVYSEPIEFPWAANLGIAYIATLDNITANTKLELWMESKKEKDTWMPFYNPSKGENASINIITGKIIPCSPYTDGRGAKAVKFKLNQTQVNDVFLEIGFVKLLSI